LFSGFVVDFLPDFRDALHVSQRSKDDDELRAWEESIGLIPSFRVEVSRVSPKVFGGRRVDGKLGQYDYLPEWDEIKDDHGGGTLRLVVKRPDEKGRLVYAVSRTTKISAPPKIPDHADLAFADDHDRDRIVRDIARRAATELFEQRLRALEDAVQDLASRC
jgi:hypothetical protein